VGVCGKDSKTAALQDLQLHFNIGLGQWAQAIEAKGQRVSDEAKDLILDSTFATLTNVNFDSSRFYGYLKRANAVRGSLAAQAQAAGVDTHSLVGPAQFQYQVPDIFSFLLAMNHSFVTCAMLCCLCCLRKITISCSWKPRPTVCSIARPS
jgi:hypothetical protein